MWVCCFSVAVPQRSSARCRETAWSITPIRGIDWTDQAYILLINRLCDRSAQYLWWALLMVDIPRGGFKLKVWRHYCCCVCARALHPVLAGSCRVDALLPVNALKSLRCSASGLECCRVNISGTFVCCCLKFLQEPEWKYKTFVLFCLFVCAASFTVKWNFHCDEFDIFQINLKLFFKKILNTRHS